MLYKTFDATGVAPNGVLLAGDLNALQALLPSLSDFTQTFDAGTVRIGASTLQLLGFSSTELRVSGAFRADGIIRSGGSGTGGVLPGTYTTSQRNSLGAGLKPFGMAVVNSDTGQWEWNSGTDGSPIWKPFGYTPSITYNTQLTSYTLALSDSNEAVEMNSSSANTVTVPLNSSIAFPIGTTITVAQLGSGQTSIVAMSGVTLRSYNSSLKLAGQYSIAAIFKRGTDDWWVAGNLVP